MADFYLDEDLTTGLNDGSSWANAYQTWAAMITGVGTLTEDSNIYMRSTGTVDLQRVLNTDTDGYNLDLYGDTDTMFLNTNEFSACFLISSPFAGTGAITLHEIFSETETNVEFCRVSTSVTVNIVNAKNIGTSGRRGIYVQFSDTINIYNSIFVGSTDGIINASSGDVTAVNCYAEADTSCYSNTSDGSLTLTTSASSDTTGSSGLQSIAYDTSTFTNVTAGTEDFHLVTGSDLIDAGTATSYTTDFDGDTWSTPREVGIYNFAAGTIYNVSISEGVGLSETQSTTIDFAAAVNETIGLSDIQSALLGLNIALSEGIGFNETQSTSVDFSVTLEDGIGLNDVIDSVATYNLSLSEGLGLSDVFTSGDLIDGKMCVTISGIRANITISAVSGSIEITATAPSIDISAEGCT
jgi:hypothetical protein